ncbi:LytR/AlgR family response regulator transcription factor [Blautia sp. HCP3S3_H10_1]|uniref:LytR/AlgR family response regulator transcription factor n=1 Tax=unclassified Blautia TaxID=2648079 RepID=UPI003F907A80
MIRIAIVEDEEEYVQQLTDYLQEYQRNSNEEIAVTVYHDGDEITSKYKSQFDIILMDIQMKFINGMTAAQEIRNIDSSVVIIFITNMTQYAIQGYKVGAMDYILKPISYFAFAERISQAITKLKKRDRHYVVVPIKGGVVRLDTADIYYIEVQGHNLIYHTCTGEYISPGTISAAEKALCNYGFSRGNKSYLINLAHVDGIQDKCAQVKGESLPLGRPRQNAFLQDLTKYWGEH